MTFPVTKNITDWYTNFLYKKKTIKAQWPDWSPAQRERLNELFQLMPGFLKFTIELFANVSHPQLQQIRKIETPLVLLSKAAVDHNSSPVWTVFVHIRLKRSHFQLRRFGVSVFHPLKPQTKMKGETWNRIFYFNHAAEFMRLTSGSFPTDAVTTRAQTTTLVSIQFGFVDKRRHCF